jgi:hypothetical protein
VSGVLAEAGLRLAGVVIGCVVGVSVIGWTSYGIKPWHLLRDRREAQRRLGRRP